MVSWRRSLVVVTVLGLAGVVIGAASAEDDQPCVGVLDMRVVFKEYSKSIRYDEELQKLEIQVKAEKKEKEEEIERLEDEIKELEEGTADWRDRRIELRKLTVRLEFWLRDLRDEIGQKLDAYTSEVEQDIRKAAKEVAEKKGLDLVLNHDPTAGESDPRLEERRIPIVLYASPRVDITKEVLEVLNRPEKEGEAPPPKTPEEERAPGEPGR